ncbi:MAG: CBS domain-containing protein [Thermodesulfobacteriota bacterium]
MQLVSDIMTKDVVTVTSDTAITEATRILMQHHFNGLPVVDEDNQLQGIICQSDIIAQQKKFPMPTFFTLFDGIIPFSSTSHLEKEMQKISAATVGQAMTPDPVTASPDTNLEEIAELMVSRNYHTIPVVEGKKLVGVVGKEDILKTLTS